VGVVVVVWWVLLWLSGGPFTTQPRVMAVMRWLAGSQAAMQWLALAGSALAALATSCCWWLAGRMLSLSCQSCGGGCLLSVMSMLSCHVSIGIGPQSVMSSCRCLSVCQSASQQKSADRATPFGCRSHFSLKGAEGSPGRPPCLPGDPRHCSLRTLQESLAPCPRPRCTLRGTAAQPGRPGAGTMLLR
jgi:hypothetical protein